MNRLTAAGIAEAALAGDRILVVVGSRPGLVLDELERRIPPDAVAQYRRFNGGEEVRLISGGRVYIRSVHSTVHLAVDTVYLDASVGHEGMLTLPERFFPCIATSPRGEILRP